MSSTTSLPVKVYYIENQVTKEIRKFNLGDDVAGNFEYLLGKIRRAFPDLLRKDIKIFWKDHEEDYLTISSDEELYQALDAIHLINNGMLKLYVKTTLQNNEDQRDHPGVTCDGCNSKVKGTRYKCTECFDFDLCSNCQEKKVHPSDHEMVCIKKPRAADHYVRHAGFFRGGCRARTNPFRRSCAGMNKCEKNTCNDKKTPKEGTNEHIGRLASAFGLDPDVANCYFVTFCDDLNSKQKEENGSGKEPKSDSSKKEETPAPNGDGDVDFQKQSPEKQETQKEDTTNTKSTGDDVTMEDDDQDQTQQPSSEQNKNELEDLVGHFAKQFGLTPDVQQNIQGGLGDLLQGIFTPQTSDIPKEEKDSQKREDYIFVDEEKKNSEEEKSEQRLNKALKQMESMGFDNDGGWLSQLLVSKDLSIARVLDALNPSN